MLWKEKVNVVVIGVVAEVAVVAWIGVPPGAEVDQRAEQVRKLAHDTFLGVVHAHGVAHIHRIALEAEASRLTGRMGVTGSVLVVVVFPQTVWRHHQGNSEWSV